MKTKNTEPRPESTKERKTISRGQALKKVGLITLAAGTMLALLNNPRKALAVSGIDPAGSKHTGWG